MIVFEVADNRFDSSPAPKPFSRLLPLVGGGGFFRWLGRVDGGVSDFGFSPIAPVTDGV